MKLAVLTLALTALSVPALAAHSDDTRAVVNYIVSELNEKLPGGYINLEEEWIFNNAGGAMGAMYIIHASMSMLLPRLEIEDACESRV